MLCHRKSTSGHAAEGSSSALHASRQQAPNGRHALLATCLFVLGAAAAPVAAQTFLPPTSSPTGFWNAVPTVHLSSNGAPDLPNEQYLGIRLSGASWNTLETSRGTYNWTPIDNYTNAGGNFLYTFQNVPTWANAQTSSITAFSITSNVVTFTANNGLIVSDKVTISGLSVGTYLNGQTLTVASRTPTQFTASFTHANVSETSDSGSAAFSGTTYQAPTDVYESESCQGVLSGTNTTDCRYKEFVTALMQHICPTQTTCKIRNFESWNEFSSNGYWDDTWQHLAKMAEDAGRIIAAYCSNCQYGAGSVSAGGTGWNDSETNTRNSSHPNWTYYDEVLGDFLTDWKNDRANDSTIPQPAFISWHAYSGYSDTSNSANGALSPQPMPEFAYSGDGSGSGGDTGSSYCSKSNESKTTNKYCVDSVVDQGTTIAALTSTSTYGVQGIPYWVTEGGFNALASMENSDNNDASGSDGTKSICTGPYDPACTADVLRSAYLARWLILLRASGVSRAYWYSWDEPCFGTLFGMDSGQDGQSNVNTCPGPQDPNVKYNPNGDTFYNIYGAKTRAGNTWDQIQLWLNGASEPTSCSLNSTTYVYSCTITRTNPSGYVGLIVWYTQWLQTTNYTPPAGYTQYRTVDNPNPVSYSSGSITLGAEPVIFEKKS